MYEGIDVAISAFQPVKAGNRHQQPSVPATAQLTAWHAARLLEQAAQAARRQGGSGPTATQLAAWVPAYILFSARSCCARDAAKDDHAAISAIVLGKELLREPGE